MSQAGLAQRLAISKPLNKDGLSRKFREQNSPLLIYQELQSLASPKTKRKKNQMKVIKSQVALVNI